VALEWGTREETIVELGTLPWHDKSRGGDAVAQDTTAVDINLMSMSERLEFLSRLRNGPATQLGVTNRWRNIEGVLTFFQDNDLGKPNSWISWVNAIVLESIERGLALAADSCTEDYGNHAAHLWADYITRYAGEPGHDRAWGEAKEAVDEYGVKVAEQVHHVVPTAVEQRFLTLTQLYNWGMRNRSVVAGLVLFSGVTPTSLDRLFDVSQAEVARRGCEVAWRLAHADGTLQEVLRQDLPAIIDKLTEPEIR
jgi:hypothetical protein